MTRVEENLEMLNDIPMDRRFLGNSNEIYMKMAEDAMKIIADISRSVAILADLESKRAHLDDELAKARRASDEYVRDHRLIQFMLDFLAFETKDKEIEQIYARWMMEGGKS